MGEVINKDNVFLAKIRKQGSGMHVYFTTEMLAQPDFPFKPKDVVVIKFEPGAILLKKVEPERLMEG